MSSKQQGLLSLKSPWTDNGNSIWLGSVLSLQRNIEKFNFPEKLPLDKRKQLFSIVTQELATSQYLDSPFVLEAEEISPTEKEYLHEHFLTLASFMEAHAGEGFVLDRSGKFLATINLNDHIRFRLLETQEDLENACNRLEKIEVSLGKEFNFSFSPRFGFLTSDPAECGTAFVASVYLQLPALIHTGKLQEFLLNHQDDSIITTGLKGTMGDIVGDLLVVRNNYTLGLTEENILASVRSYATKLIVLEQSERKKLKESENTAIKNLVSRAYAVLVHSYNIEVAETMNAISLLKLGLELGWLDGVTFKELNALFFSCRRAHILAEYGEELDHAELPHKRADFIHSILKNAKLHIEE